MSICQDMFPLHNNGEFWNSQGLPVMGWQVSSVNFTDWTSCLKPAGTTLDSHIYSCQDTFPTEALKVKFQTKQPLIGNWKNVLGAFMFLSLEKKLHQMKNFENDTEMKKKIIHLLG